VVRASGACILVLAAYTAAWSQTDGPLRAWVAYPEEWIRVTPQQAGLDLEKFNEVLTQSSVRQGGWRGNQPDEHQ